MSACITGEGMKMSQDILLRPPNCERGDLRQRLPMREGESMILKGEGGKVGGRIPFTGPSKIAFLSSFLFLNFFILPDLEWILPAPW